MQACLKMLLYWARPTGTCIGWQGKVRQPLTGWFGHEAPFDFATHYKPAGDIRQYLCSTPPVISLAALEVRKLHASAAACVAQAHVAQCPRCCSTTAQVGRHQLRTPALDGSWLCQCG